MKFKVGDKVKVLRKDATFGWVGEMIDYVGNVFEIDAVKMASTGVDMLQGYKIGMYCWSEDALELAQPKFNPKPGDKIICNNGEEFICCTLEFLHSKGLGTGVKDSDILGYRDSDHGRWMYWNKNGKVDEDDWHIKEVIPAQQEVKQEVTEVMKTTMQEKTYTLKQIEDVVFAIRDEFHMIHPLGTKFMITKVQEHLQKKKNHPEYKLYLELKAKFEGK